MTPTTREAVERFWEQRGEFAEEVECVRASDYDALLAEAEGLRRALLKYSKHVPGCGKNIAPNWTCDCGLSAAIARGEEA